MTDGYSRESTWYFTAGGEEWEVVGFDGSYLEFKETRCNGQEDDHVTGIAHLLGSGAWLLEKSAYSELEHYRDGKTQLARDIEAYLNEHGPPVD